MKKRLHGILIALMCALCMSMFLTACNGGSYHDHDYVEIESLRIEPTCTMTGTKFLICACGDESTAVIPALGHDYKIKNAESETTQQDIICKVCGRLNTSDKDKTPDTDIESLVCNPITVYNELTQNDTVVGYSVDGISGEAGRYLKIPEKIKVKENNLEKEYDITAIGEQAFKGCAVESVYLSSNITTIGDGAFADCANLVGITLPERNLTSVGADVFSGCTKLFKTKYESAYYLGCDSNEYVLCIEADGGITDLTVNGSTRIIADKVFYGRTELKTVTIADSVGAFGEQTFGGCVNIETATMPTAAIPYVPKDSLKNVKITSGRTIEENAFNGCSTLKVLEVANTVRTVGDDAFTGCDGIEEITVSTVVVRHVPKANLVKAVISSTTASTDLPDGTFKGCTKLVSVTANVVKIGKNAFEGCTALPEIELSQSLEVIGDSAFLNCAALGDITVKTNVKSIGKHAFYGCQKLTDIVYTGDIIDWGAITFVDEYSTPLCYGAKLHYKGISDRFEDKEQEKYNQ